MGRQPFSEQLRRAIEECGTSRYALARSVGVSDSALSRFMSGERGLTLATLDKLADALGLEIVIGVQRIPRNKPRGRRPAGGKQMAVNTAKRKRMSKFEWYCLAREFAIDAYENHLSSRRGIWFLEKLAVLCLYNNNAYANDPTLRDKETDEFRRRMKGEGIKELAYATYPPEGQEGAGYTYAMLIDAGEEKTDWVIETMMAIIAEKRRKLDR
jgi:transcriptional regulator with XRE-family HTH domain